MSRPASHLLARGAAALAALAVAFAASAAPPVPSAADRETFLAAHRLAHPLRPTPAPPRALASQQDVDVQRYDLSLFLDFATESIQGTCLVTAVAAPGSASVDELVLDLHDRLAVTSVDRDGTPVGLGSVTHAGNVLRIPLLPPLVEGSGPTRVSVAYEGQPLELSFGCLTFDVHDDPPQPIAFTLSEPFFGRGWWPCKDVPDDKALVALHVEAPAELVVASNGVNTSIVPGRAGHLVTTWEERHPISTYLVAVSATNFVSWSDVYTALDGTTTMPVTHWAWPEKELAAREDWSRTPEMVRFFAETFFEYPFLDEKYGNVMVPLWGGMEHQTATSYGAQLVTGDHRYDFVNVHELAHQWWGDHVGPTTFDSIWLNEGFATYCEALWWEHEGDLASYRGYMRNLDILPARGVDFEGTVHAPTDYFNNTVYYKGAWVLHMLRWVLAQPGTDAEPLLQIMRAHGAEHSYADASTDDFAATAARVSGQDLTWFFDQWVHRVGRPWYDVGWSAAPQPAGDWVVYLRVRQTQGGAPYRMPVQVRIVLPSGPQDVVVMNELALEDYELRVSEPPTNVLWDPDGWVLKDSSTVDVDRDDDGWPDWVDGCPSVPNPDQEDANGNTLQDACETGGDYDGDGVDNDVDCAAADAWAWAPPPDATVIHVTKDARGIVLSFTNPDVSPQRPCSTDVGFGDLAVLRSMRTRDSASCLIPRHPDPELVDPTAMPASGAAWFDAWPFNGCGPSPGAGPCR